MDYYYADAVNEPRGPVSEEVLKNLFFQRRIRLDDNVLLSGTDNWRRLRDCFPDLEFYRGCPKCYQKVTVEDAECPNCSFPIRDYEDNLSGSRRRPIEARQATEAQIDALVRAELSAYNSGCFLVFILCFSLLLLFVPYVGVFLGAGTFLFGLVAFFSPVALKLWWYKNTSGNKLGKLRAKAIEQLTSPFHGPCPNCNCEITKPTSGTTLKCPRCQMLLLREDSYIYYIPHPAAIVAHGFDALFVAEPKA